MFLCNLDVCHFILYSKLEDSCFIIEIDFDAKVVFEEYLPKLQYVYFSYMLRVLADPINGMCDNNNIENCDPN